MKLDMNDMCFACGQRNTVGLKLQFQFEGDDYVTTLRVQPEHQGWAGIVHGGLLATALDESMARLLWEKDLNAITGRLEVRYHQPVHVGESLQIRARITRRRSPAIETAAEALNAEGATVAEARAMSMEV